MKSGSGLPELQHHLIRLAADGFVEDRLGVIVRGAVECVAFARELESGRFDFLDEHGLVDAVKFGEEPVRL